MRVYLAGPIEGNAHAFASAAAELDRVGHEPLDPARLTLDLRGRLGGLIACDGIALLDGWAFSRAASLEAHVGHALGMAVRPLSTWLCP